MHYNTVNPHLRSALNLLMQEPIFESFRLVGGTSLSLQIGHRLSVDIDLFTDADYGTIDFDEIDRFLENNFEGVQHTANALPGMGKSYFITDDNLDAAATVKLDVYYSMEKFIQAPLIEDQIRMATVEEIIAMKIDVVQRTGRKKDFWDIHALLSRYSISDMIALHALRYEWTHDRALILSNFLNFDSADQDLDPICLRGNEWAFIKEDLEEAFLRSRL